MTYTKSPKPIFIIDRMIHGLARWLRFLGFYSIHIEDMEHVASIKNQYPNTIFITTSKKNFNKFGDYNAFLLKKNTIPEQLLELNNVFRIYKQIDLLSICSICNIQIEPVNKDEIQNLIPDRVWNSFQTFWRCPKCQRIYWHGGHIERLINKLRQMNVPLNKNQNSKK